MSRSKHFILVMLVTLLGLALPISSFAVYEKNELSASYRALVANVGGMSLVGARYRTEFYELQAGSLNSQFMVSAGYAPRFDLKKFFTPRIILGAGVSFGGFGPIAGISLNFPIFSVLSGKVGLSLDSYIYGQIHGSRIAVVPVVPLSLTYAY